MSLWGVPPAGTPEAAAFWASFWPAFWSGAVYSVICGVISGLVVGLVVLRYQRGWEARTALRGYERDLSLLLDDLRSALSEPEVVALGSAQRAVPVAAGAALTHLKAAPLSLWRDHIPSKTTLIQAAIDLQRRATEFLGAAREFDNGVAQVARSYNYDHQTVANHDGPISQYLIGRTLGVDHEQLLKWIPDTGVNYSIPFEKIWTSLDSPVQKLGSRFTERREALMKQAHVLLRAIDA